MGTHRRGTGRWWGVLAAVAAAAAPAAGQSPDILRLDFDEPQLVLSPGGRSGACDVLRFAAGGRELLAAGDDKVVHAWAVGPGGLDYRRPLRWNVFRERRGSIYALALSPDEQRAAVAGLGRKDADVVILDRATGAVAASLSAESHPGYQTASTVWSLAYSAAGDRLAVGHDDGSVWVWVPDGPGRGTAVRLAGPVADAAAVADRRGRVVWVGFAGDAVRFARGDGAVFEVGPGDARPRELFRFGYPIARAVAPADGRWLAGCPLRRTADGTRIELRALPGGGVAHAIEFPKNERNDHNLLPVALATDPAGRRLAVGTWWAAVGNRFSPLRKGDVRLYDLTGDAPRRVAVGVFDGDHGRPALTADAVAVHPEQNVVAVAGGPDHETGLWRVEGEALARVGEPAVGVGRGVWQVGTRDDGAVIALRQTPNPDPAGPNDRGTGGWRGFDLTRPGWAVAAEPTETAVAELNGWRVEIDPVSEFTWTAVNGEFRYPLPFNPNTDDRPTCYTFLPGPDPRRTRLAVGHYWGFKVFELRPGFAPPVVARGVGHQGAVTSIAPARGGQMLVTGSDDQTVGLWAVRPWDHHPLLGAGFDWAADPATGRRAFTVTAVQAGSPAWEAGLLPGDRVAGLSYDGAAIREPGEGAAGLIARAEPDHELAFLVERPGPGGKPVLKGVKTRMLTRPQARLFPTAGHDWVLYKYADYFYACSTNGDAYLGWLIGGRLAADAPEFHPAARFRDVFYRPTGVRDALAGLVREPSRPLTRTYLPPAVAVRASAAATRDQPITLTVAVRPRADANGRPVPIEKVELWLDDEVLLNEWPGTGGAEFRGTYEVAPHRLRVGRNKLTVVGHARTRGEAAVEVQNDPGRRPPPAIRGLAVGVDTYPYLTATAQLTAAAADARLMKQAVEGLARDRAVRAAGVDLLLNAEATPAAVLAAIDRIGKDLGPDDWLVVFLAGHGLAEPEAAGARAGVAVAGGRAAAGGRPRMKPGTWFFCGAAPAAGAGPAAGGGVGGERQVLDLARGNVGELIGRLKAMNCTVPGRELLARLAPLNCRKLVLIDSCHSGAIEQDPGRDLRPDDRGAVVLAAAAPDETAAELDLPVDRAGRPAVERHGVFSAAVGGALRDRAADRNRDGLLTLEELHLAVAAAVRDARRKAGIDRPGRSQTVLACPADLRNVVFVGDR